MSGCRPTRHIDRLSQGGHSAVTRFLNRTYGETAWTRSTAHDWLKAIRPPCVIDLNRDTQLQDSYAGKPHTLIVGIARLGGFAIPPEVKQWRQGKRYLLLGLRLNRDTERMLLSDLMFGAAENPSGWALLADPSPKEIRFCQQMGLLILADKLETLCTTP